MEGPGGYQFVGRTVQVWNTFKQTTDFHSGKPWLLRFFDQIRFYPMAHADLLRYREAFVQGKVQLDIQEETFSLKQYNDFLLSISDEVAAFKDKQLSAFEAERDRWAVNNQLTDLTEPVQASDEVALDLPPNSQVVESHIPANVWQIVVEKGTSVAVGDRLMVLESMKMEIAVVSPASGTVIEVLCKQGQMVSVGQALFVIQSTVS